MAKRTTAGSTGKQPLPRTLKDHNFFGLTLDDEQLNMADKIIDENIRAVFTSSVAGTGKTTVAVCAAVLMVEYGAYSDIVYCTHPVGDAQGFLPGTISDKSSVWFEGLYQALVTANRNPDQVIADTSIVNMKNGTGFVKAVTDTYLRGSTIGSEGKTVFILDEAQNFDEHSLRKALTRANDNTKVIVIGHPGQIDLLNKSASGFERCIRHFIGKGDPRFAYCELKTNHRGLVSRTADEVWE